MGQQVLPADVGLGRQVLKSGPVHGLGALPDVGADVTVQLHAEQLQLSLQGWGICGRGCDMGQAPPQEGRREKEIREREAWI